MFELATYTPSEAAKISGVNVALQRDWRRREILPRRDGHARYTPFELAELMALSALAVQGVGPQKFTSIANMLAAGIVDAAMDQPEAYDGPMDLVVNDEEPEWLREWVSGANEYKTWRWDYDLLRWRMRRIKRRVHLWQGYDPSVVRSFFIQWANGTFAFEHSPIAPYEMIEESDPRRRGAVLILDLAGLGSALVERAPGFVKLDAVRLQENVARSKLYADVEAIKARLGPAPGSLDAAGAGA